MFTPPWPVAPARMNHSNYYGYKEPFFIKDQENGKFILAEKSTKRKQSKQSRATAARRVAAVEII